MRFSERKLSLLIAFVFTVIFFIFWLWTTWEIGQVSTLRCQRLEPTVVNCSLQKTFLGISTSAQTINSIRRVEWSENCDDEGCAYFLVLHTRAGESYTVRATEADKGSFPKFQAFVQGEDALPEITLAVSGNWFEWLTLIGIGLIIASGFFIPWFLERRAAKN